VFTWESGADGDDAEEDRGEQQQRGPAQASVLRAGEQQHPWGLLDDGEPQTEFVVIPPSLRVYVSI